MPRFKLEPVDETFFATAPTRFAETFEIQRSAPEVWEELCADGALGFCRLLSGADWTSPRPYGVGTTRTMKAVYGAIVIAERFFLWEEGKRFSFYVERCNLPIFKRFAEDYVVEATSPSSCRFTWTIALEPTAAGRPGGPVNALLTRSFFKDTRKHFAVR